MTTSVPLPADTQLAIRHFFKQYHVISIEVMASSGICEQTPVADILVMCEREPGEADSRYQVNFKLQQQAAEIAQYLLCIETGPPARVWLRPEHPLVWWRDSASKLSQQASGQLLKDFINNITIRIKEAKREQSIQSIQFVGNHFVLNNTTVFKVLSDDGNGRLSIDIQGDGGEQSLLLSAHGLMDGLYMGAIKPVQIKSHPSS